MNKVFLSGNLTRDPEVRYTQNGKAYCRMGIAVRRQFSKDKDAVDFFNLIAWEKTAEFCGKWLVKGSRVLVEGRLQTSSYEKDGVKVNAVDIHVDNIEFAGSKTANGGDGGYQREPRDNGGYRGDDGYRRDNRDDDDYPRNNRDDGYRRNNRNDDYRRNRDDGYQQPARDNEPKKDYDEEFIGDQIDLEDPPF